MASWSPDKHRPLWPYADPDGSPFRTPPTEGLPYKKGSQEDQAIRRILGLGERLSWWQRLLAWIGL
jgi:hypothetical protein